jgi:predicted dithiol-disulfide oxidoreductase (DUF899 family)
VPVEKEYSFETAGGTKSLAELFDGRSQLLIYHLMFGPEYEAGCPVCSSIADNLNANLPHLRARDVTMICSSRAPLDKLQGYKKRMGWSFDWVSTVGPDFHRDLDFLHTEEELRPFLEGEMPPNVTQNADACGTDVARYVAERWLRGWSRKRNRPRPWGGGQHREETHDAHLRACPGPADRGGPQHLRHSRDLVR